MYEEKQGDGKKGRGQEGVISSLPDSGQPLRQNDQVQVGASVSGLTEAWGLFILRRQVMKTG